MRFGGILFFGTIMGTASLEAQVLSQGSDPVLRIDPTDPAFTTPGGVQVSRPSAITADGRYVVGQSQPSAGGLAPWIYDTQSGLLTRLGLWDPEHSRNDSRQYSGLTVGPLDADWIAGISLRYNGGSTQRGESAWLYHRATGLQIQVGFTGPRFTRADGTRLTTIRRGPSENGFLAGHSQAYETGSSGQVSWIYDPFTGQTSEIGLSGPEFTAGNGAVLNTVSGSPNLFGDVGGSTGRFIANAPAGSATWYHDHRAGTTTRIGFWDADHTGADGIQESATEGSPANSGFLAGWSRRYTPTTSSGTSAWIYRADSNLTTEIGLVDPAHVTADGTRFNRPAGDPTNSGFIVGTSQQVGIAGTGNSVWIYDANSDVTTKIGLLSGDHLQANGGSTNSLTAIGTINEAGFVAGGSVRYGSGGGLSAWIHGTGDTESRRVGLFDALHTSTSGEQRTEYSVFPTERGTMAGASTRYSGATANGQTAWVYHYATDTTTSFEISLTPDGYASSEILDVSDAFGLIAVGSFAEYSASGDFLGRSAFAWNPITGLIDINAEFADQAALQGFTRLTSADSVSDTGWVTGRGDLDNGGVGTYLIYIPEPGSVLLAGIGLLITAARRRR